MNCKHPYPDTCCCGARYRELITAKFRGGSIGGEQMVIAREDLKGYRIPVLAHPPGTIVQTTGPLPEIPMVMHRTETYRFEGRMDDGMYVMQWVDPVPALELKVQELHRKIDRARSALV